MLDGDQQDAPRSPRVITGRLVRMGDAERDFDDAFWRAIPPHQRVEMLWDMVLDALAVKGIHGEPRLQRSVGSVRRP
jgi:hypothetical protein